jgi:hypothetical protein
MLAQMIQGLNEILGRPSKSRVTQSDPAESKEKSSGERRDYGVGVKLWNDKDPRSDQSFFLGGVPGFILSQDQRIIDWNIAFETAFTGIELIKRGMPVSDWYKELDNFRRLPNREAQLYGEAVVPITDRDRVVYNSPVYGRMVFMKIMSPVLDRISGRIIGWNITLNINSVSKRQEFFEDLYARIERQSRHARYVVGVEQILSESQEHKSFLKGILSNIGSSKHVLIMGAVKAECLVESMLELAHVSTVTIVDDDADGLRLIRARCSRFQNRIKLVRRRIDDCSKLPMTKFDCVIVYYPRIGGEAISRLLSDISSSLSESARLLIAGYSGHDAAKIWWNELRRDLEGQGKLDVMKWHWNTVSVEEDAIQMTAFTLPGDFSEAVRTFHKSGFSLESANFGLLSGVGSVLRLRSKAIFSRHKQAI